MYWCHQRLDDKTIAEELTSALEDPSFEEWTECSLNHLLIIGSGYNGEENKDKANKLLAMYKRDLCKKGKVLKWAHVKTLQSFFKLPNELTSSVSVI